MIANDNTQTKIESIFLQQSLNHTWYILLCLPSYGMWIELGGINMIWALVDELITKHHPQTKEQQNINNVFKTWVCRNKWANTYDNYNLCILENPPKHWTLSNCLCVWKPQIHKHLLTICQFLVPLFLDFISTTTLFVEKSFNVRKNFPRFLNDGDKFLFPNLSYNYCFVLYCYVKINP